MKLVCLVIIGLLIALTSCKKRPDCASGILNSCQEEIIDSSPNYDMCECVCSNDGTGGVFKSPIDNRAFCWWESRPEYSMDYEVYGFDHHQVRPNGFEERVLGTIEIFYDGYKLFEREDIPYQGRAEFNLRYPLWPSCNKPHSFVNQQPFYMKENKRDTLFMDLLVGFYFANTHVICGDFYFTKSYMVRREGGLDWYCNLYGVPEGADGVDIRFAAHNDEIEPDTTFFIHMPRLFQKG